MPLIEHPNNQQIKQNFNFFMNKINLKYNLVNNKTITNEI